MIVAVVCSRLDKEVTRWNAAMENAEASEEYDEAVCGESPAR